MNEDQARRTLDKLVKPWKSNYAKGNKRQRRKHRAIETAKYFETKEGMDSVLIHQMRKSAIEKALYGFIVGDGGAISEAFFEYVNKCADAPMNPEIYENRPDLEMIRKPEP